VTETIIPHLTLDALREALQAAGYRVEDLTDPIAGVPYLRSATGGLAFDVRPGNRLAADQDAFLDAAFVAILQVQGELPLDVVNQWNVTRRFARLQLSPPFLVLTLDLSAAGGVTPAHLRANIEIWDRLLQDLIGYLREALRTLTAKNATHSAGQQSQPKAEEAAQSAAPPPVSLQ
jgi:hypothetical protein